MNYFSKKSLYIFTASICLSITAIFLIPVLELWFKERELSSAEEFFDLQQAIAIKSFSEAKSQYIRQKKKNGASDKSLDLFSNNGFTKTAAYEAVIDNITSHKSIRYPSYMIEFCPLKEKDLSSQLDGKTSFRALIGEDIYKDIKQQGDFVIVQSISQENIFKASKTYSFILWVMLAVVNLVFVASYFFYIRHRKHIFGVIKEARQIAKGNYEKRVNVAVGTQFGEMTEIVNQLAIAMQKQKALENQLVQAQKMEIVGTLSSGIAHDFNNTLSGVMSGLELLREELKRTDGQIDRMQLQKTLDIARTCTKRGKETVDLLVSFSRQAELSTEVVDLNEIMRNVYDYCDHSFSRNIKLNFEPLDSPAAVKGDQTLLEQAMINICINAKDAMNNEGNLSISVHQEQVQTPHPDIASGTEHYCITISDSGCGMSKETIMKIFEPFFTTKRKGTGLGLAMVYKIIGNHKGCMDIKSEPDQGTSFLIYIPLSEDKKIKTSKRKSVNIPAPTKKANGQKVLVIDDDEHLIELTKDILERQGYKAILAADGTSGVELALNTNDIELILVDLMLPDISGEEVFEQVREKRPQLPVILISGMKRDPRIADMLVKGCAGFVAKPFGIDELLKVIEATLSK